ncbi:ADP-L-glycero-D-manno-heptose-6-epimerase [Streptomyces hirsutus]
MSGKYLVTGGAGYVGSVVAQHLLEAGHEAVVLDNLSTGVREAVPAGASFIEGDIRDAATWLDPSFDGVLHFAAFSQVGESVVKPEKYWDNNVGGTMALLGAMREAGVRRLVFSSTAATYGEPEQVPIVESAAATRGEHLICNLGNGNGFSVREVVETVRRVTGHPIPEVVAPRRGGDPAVLVASAAAAHEKLGWKPSRSDLAGIVADAWEFAQRQHRARGESGAGHERVHRRRGGRESGRRAIPGTVRSRTAGRLGGTGPGQPHR